MTLHKFSFKMHGALGTTQEFQVPEGYTVSKRAWGWGGGGGGQLQLSSWASSRWGEGGKQGGGHGLPLVCRVHFFLKTTYGHLHHNPHAQLDGFSLFFAQAQGGAVA